MILVTGDVVLDHNIYAGHRSSPTADDTPGFVHHEDLGGAHLTFCLLEALQGASAGTQGTSPAPVELLFGLEAMKAEELREWPPLFHFGSLWHAHGGPGRKHVWRLRDSLGYGEGPATGCPAKPAVDLNKRVPNVFVIEDGGFGFRNKEWKRCWPDFLALEQRPAELEWVILKMSRPLAVGDLWTQLMRPSWLDRLILIVSADQLRSEGLRVAGGLSWETSVDDIIDELESNRALRELKLARHLVVIMRSDAALWLDRAAGGNVHAQLIFDRRLCEGEWEEQHKDWNAYGFLSTVTASVAWGVSQAQKPNDGPSLDASDEVDLTIPLAASLSGTRFLREYGHGSVPGKPHFPFGKLAEHLKCEALKQETDASKRSYATAEVRNIGGCSLTGGGRCQWTILGQVSPWHAARKLVSYEPARRVALFGPESLLGVPCATFGRLQTFDRHEIDSLRSIRRLMLMYKEHGSWKQPLCVGVFGAPGSGKSFGLKQIAEGVFGSKCPILEFNLSQFNDEQDLVGAFHQVRDKVLTGETPVVFWDEFDSNDLKWLQHFLAPMQDGTFQGGQVTHSIGKAVFVFAGGVSHTFADFDRSDSKDSRVAEEFRARKGTDFVSRFAGYLNIAGPNPRATGQEGIPDLEYPVRRAMVIRIALELGDQELQIERGLLTALLGAGKYRNGARSLEKLVRYIEDSGGMPLRRAYLPPDEILALYVEDVEEFRNLSRKYADFYAKADLLARRIHENYLAGLDEETKKNKPNAKPWSQLDASIRESNYAAAFRIPQILESAGLTLEEGKGESSEFKKALQEKLEEMAEAEHGGWEEQKRIEGWTYSARRNDRAFRHDLLKPYGQLKDQVKEWDRDAIRKYPKHAALAGFRIVPLPSPIESNHAGKKQATASGKRRSRKQTN